MDEWIAFIRDLGFPIVVCFYLLFRLERVLAKVNGTLSEIQGILFLLFGDEEKMGDEAKKLRKGLLERIFGEEDKSGAGTKRLRRKG